MHASISETIFGTLSGFVWMERNEASITIQYSTIVVVFSIE